MSRKLISIVIPCFNSASYMSRAIESVLPYGQEAEIIIVDDGSRDETGLIADTFQANYPDICIAVHKENGGHGDAIMTGLRLAKGIYFDVLDSDDWMDEEHVMEMLINVRKLSAPEKQVDLIIRNTIYDKIKPSGKRHTKVVHFHGIMPVNKPFSWEECGYFRLGKLIFMHSAVFRTELLRESGLSLPLHTFYVDHLYVYIPMRRVRTMYYMDLDLYHYLIGRDGQSIQKETMLRQVDQAYTVCKTMISAYDLEAVNGKQRIYLRNYLEMVVASTYAFLTRSGKQENIKKRKELIHCLAEKCPWFLHSIRFRMTGFVLSLPSVLHEVGIWIAYQFCYYLFRFN